MNHTRNSNGFLKIAFHLLLWVGLLYASLGQALGQVPETATKSSETATKSSETATKSSETATKSSETAAKSSETAAKSSETGAKPSETAEPAELKEEKSEVTKPVPGSLKDFGILHTNNIFDPNRKPYRPERKRQAPEPEPQIDAFTLIGLMAYADRQIAVLSGSSSEYSGAFKLNDQIDNLKLVSLSDKAISFAEGEATFNVDIGTSLRRVDGGAWKESSERVRTASKSGSSRSQYSSRGTTRRGENEDSAKDAEDKEDESGGATDSEAELIRKMMERRRQEVGE
jgi:hypothetical protein